MIRTNIIRRKDIPNPGIPDNTLPWSVQKWLNCFGCGLGGPKEVQVESYSLRGASEPSWEGCAYWILNDTLWYETETRHLIFSRRWDWDLPTFPQDRDVWKLCLETETSRPRLHPWVLPVHILVYPPHWWPTAAADTPHLGQLTSYTSHHQMCGLLQKQVVDQRHGWLCSQWRKEYLGLGFMPWLSP